MNRGDPSRLRMRSAVIDAAASVFARLGAAASMDDVAAAAGIGRATLYRYFSRRDELIDAMADASVQELVTRISDAGLESAPIDEGVARLARAIITTGHKFAAISADSAAYSARYPDFETKVIQPMRDLIKRGIAQGSLRGDLAPDLQIDLLSGLIRGALDATATGRRSVEEAAAAVASVFLDGARPQGDPDRITSNPAPRR